MTKRSLALLLLAAACARTQPEVKPPAAAAESAAKAAETAAAAQAEAKRAEAAKTRPPASRREEIVETLHGVAVADPYRWLEEEKSPEVQAWMSAQDAFARRGLGALPGREALVKRIAELSYVEVIDAPLHRGTRWFSRYRAKNADKSLIRVREGHDGKDAVLLDPLSWAQDGSVALGQWEPSWDGRKVAFGKRANNSDEATLYVMDAASGAVSDRDVIDGAKYANVSWTPKGDGFYYGYTPLDPRVAQTDRTGTTTLRFHKLGTDPKTDPVVHEATGNPRRYLSGEVTRDGHWLIASSSDGVVSTDVWFKDARKPGAKWTPLVTGRQNLYEVSEWKDRFYIHTNDGAPAWQVLRADPLHPAREKWVVLIPERKDATLRELAIVGGRLSVQVIKDVMTHLELYSLEGKPVRELVLPGPGTATNLSGLEDDDEAYYAFQNYQYPRAIYRTSVKTGATSLFARLDVPVDPSPYVTEQVFFTSKDGTRVPMFVLRRKDMKRDGSTKVFLYGYGGFQIPLLPAFSGPIYAWLEQGGAYAVANLRGGSEYGEAWHAHGMGLEKQHVFDDFIGAAEKLIADGVTTPARLAISGRSNGGLLVGAAETQRPDLFGVVLCGVPLLDMIRYPLFGQAKSWIAEYGSAEDDAQFRNLLAYSPYHHVSAGTQYPATLLLSADADDRVDPMHARKFTAALQAATAGGPVWLRIEAHSGHGGADLVRANVERTADEYAFALANLLP